MIEIRYRFEIKKRDDQQLQDEIVALGLTGFIGLCTSADIVEVLFSTGLLETDVVKLDATVSAHVPDPATQLKRVRAGAVAALVSSADPLAQAVRAAVMVLLDEVNAVRAKVTPPLPARTAAQFRTAVAAKLNAGAAD